MPEIKETLKRTGPDSMEHTFSDGKTEMAVNLSFSQLQELILGAVKAAKEPDEETKAAVETERNRRAAYMQASLLEAREQEQNKQLRQERCGHRKPDQRSAWHGQIHSDGLIHPICVICQAEQKPYPPPREMVTGMGF